MVKVVRIYFEGDEALRPGFHGFLKQLVDAVRSKKIRFTLVAANGTPVEDYHDAIKTHPGAWNVLPLDSEDAVSIPSEDLCARMGLAGLSNSVFWMVQAMESWFLADPVSLQRYCGDGFRTKAIEGNPQVEQIPKTDVQSKLKAATKGTQKGEYYKTSHAPDLLGRIHPDLVKGAAPNCRRLFDALAAKLAEGRG